jgi:tetratricopeptide (TPR) repeat protein
VLGENHVDVAASLGSLGKSIARALSHTHTRARAQTPTHTHTHTHTHTPRLLGAVHEDLKEYDDAAACHSRALRVRQAACGAEHPSVASSLFSLGRVRAARGQHKEAIGLCVVPVCDFICVFLRSEVRTHARTRERGRGHTHTHTRTHTHTHAHTHTRARTHTHTHTHTFPRYEQALAIQLKALGEDSPAVARTNTAVGKSYFALGDPKKAIDWHERALMAQLNAVGDRHPDVAATYACLGSAHRLNGDAREAMWNHEKALGVARAAYGECHTTVADSFAVLADSADAAHECVAPPDY